MKRALVTALYVITGAVALAWVLSPWWAVTVRGGGCVLAVNEGYLYTGYIEQQKPLPLALILSGPGFRPKDMNVPFAWWFTGWRQGASWGVMTPMWTFVVVLAAASAACAWRSVRRRRRDRKHGCPSCGYSRLGLGPSAACPECGAAPAITLPSG